MPAAEEKSTSLNLLDTARPAPRPPPLSKLGSLFLSFGTAENFSPHLHHILKKVAV